MVEHLAGKLVSLIILLLCILITIIWHIVQFLDSLTSPPSLSNTKKKIGDDSRPVSPQTTSLITAEPQRDIICQPASPEAKLSYQSNMMHRIRDFSGETLADELEIIKNNQTDNCNQTASLAYSSQCLNHKGFTHIRSVSPKTSYPTCLVSKKHLQDACLLCFFQPLQPTSNSLTSSTTQHMKEPAPTQLGNESMLKPVTCSKETSRLERAGLDANHLSSSINATSTHPSAETGHPEDQDISASASVTIHTTDQPLAQDLLNRIEANAPSEILHDASMETEGEKRGFRLQSGIQSTFTDMTSEDNVRVAHNLASEIFTPEEEGCGLNHIFPFLAKNDPEIMEENIGLDIKPKTDVDNIQDPGERDHQALTSSKTEASSDMARNANEEEKVPNHIGAYSGSGQESFVEVKPYGEDSMIQNCACQATSSKNKKHDLHSYVTCPEPCETDNFFVPLGEGSGLSHVFPFLVLNKKEDPPLPAIRDADSNIVEIPPPNSPKLKVLSADDCPGVRNEESELRHVFPFLNEAVDKKGENTDQHIMEAEEDEEAMRKSTHTLSFTDDSVSSSDLFPEYVAAGQSVLAKQQSQVQSYIASQYSRFEDLNFASSKADPEEDIVNREYQPSPKANPRSSDARDPELRAEKVFTALPPASSTQTASSPTSTSLDSKAVDISFSPAKSVDFTSGSISEPSPSPSESRKQHYDEGSPSKRMRSATTIDDKVLDETLEDPKAESANRVGLFPAPEGFNQWSGLTHSAPADGNQGVNEQSVPNADCESKVGNRSERGNTVAEAPKSSKTQKRREERKRAKALKKAKAEAKECCGNEN